MFYFGNPEDIAESYITSALSSMGPKMMEGDLEELAEEDLAIAYVYTRLAFDSALNIDGAPQEVVDILMDKHDELFCHLVARHYTFREKFRNGFFKPVQTLSKEIRAKYLALFREYDPSAN